MALPAQGTALLQHQRLGQSAPLGRGRRVQLLERSGLLERGFDLSRELTVTLPAPLAPGALEQRSFARLLKGLALGPGQTATFAATDIAAFMRWPLHATEDQLLDWQAAGWLTVKGRQRSLYVEVLPHSGDLRDRLTRVLNQMSALAQRRIDDMIGYATGERCRHGYISAHFGSPPRLRCTVCDTCTGIRPDVAPAERPTYALPDAADVEPIIVDCLMSMSRPVGRSALARVLVGSARASAAQDKARHFGALKGLGESAILMAIDEMLEDGRLRQYARQGYMVLAPAHRSRVVAEAWQAQHGAPAAESDATDGEEAAAAPDVPNMPRYTNLQRALWAWRRRLAESLGQPPYVVMSNDLMLRVAERRPQSRTELEEIPGIGAQRSAHHGDAILDLVKMYPEQTGDADLLLHQRAAQVAQQQAVAPEPAAVSPQLERRVYLRLQELRQKLAIASGSKQFEVASNALLRAIAERAPHSLEELAAVPGFTESRLAREATQIVAYVWALRQQV
jgi:superfamily II DNA helicase RecQ